MKWRAKRYKKYYTISIYSGRFIVIGTLEGNNIWDLNKFKQGDYFRTKKEAQIKLKQILKVLKGD